MLSASHPGTGPAAPKPRCGPTTGPGSGTGPSTGSCGRDARLTAPAAPPVTYPAPNAKEQTEADSYNLDDILAEFRDL